MKCKYSIAKNNIQWSYVTIGAARFFFQYFLTPNEEIVFQDKFQILLLNEKTGSNDVFF